MLSQPIWIGIVIVAFIVGLSSTYLIFHTGSSDVIFSNTYDPNTMKFANQELFDQMMSNNPKMMANWMETIMQDAQFHDQAMDYMVKNPEQMNQWMVHDPKHIEEMSIAMRENHDFMMKMMSVIMNDPDLRFQIIGHMTENQEAMDMMKKIMDSSMMDSMMDDSSMMSSMSFNPEMPITIPMIDGYYNGEKVYFIHTEISDKDIADMMTSMINFPTLHVPDLDEISPNDLGKVYIFTNGIAGSGPYGGGPFFFQIDIFDSVPGMDEYNQFRVPQLVTWNEDSNPILLTSIEELFEAEANGELSIKTTDFVVNAPIIVWTSDGTTQTASMIQNMFESMSGVEGELTFVDENNYVAIFKLHSEKGMDMQK